MSNNMQKEGESLWEFIYCLCNNRNVIPEVDDKSIIMFFKKWLRDPSLIRKLAMKNPGLEEMFAIANKYALAEETTLDDKKTKKDKKPSQSDRPDTSQCNDKKRKHDRSVANMEWPRHNRTEYQPRSGEFEGFIDGISASFILKENTRLETAMYARFLQTRFSSRPRRPIMTRSLKTPRATSPKLTRRLTTYSMDLIPMSQGGSRSSWPGRSWH
jgi:hypothetical protein